MNDTWITLSIILIILVVLFFCLYTALDSKIQYYANLCENKHMEYAVVGHSQVLCIDKNGAMFFPRKD